MFMVSWSKTELFIFRIFLFYSRVLSTWMYYFRIKHNFKFPFLFSVYPLPVLKKFEIFNNVLLLTLASFWMITFDDIMVIANPICKLIHFYLLIHLGGDHLLRTLWIQWPIIWSMNSCMLYSENRIWK